MATNMNFTELGTQPIRSLLIKYATPAVVAMTASSLYNIIDAIYIGQGVGALAIAGISLTFPVMQLTAAFGAMVGVGAATLLSVKLGEKDYTTARKILGNVLMLNIIMGLGIGFLMYMFINPILYFFGASEETVSYARDFMKIILYGNVITHLYLGLNSLLRACGHPKSSMYCTIYTVVLNAILAPIFIYLLHWGIKGAAFATVLSQTIVLLWQFKLFNNPNEFLHFEHGIYKLNKNIVRDIFEIGLSPFLINLCGCLISVLFNWSLAFYGGDLEIASYGISNRMIFFFLMIIMGLNQGMQPIAGYNYGARNYRRIDSVLKQTIFAATIVCTIGYMMCMLFSYECVRAFTTDPELIERAVHDMRIMFTIFPIIGFQIVVTNFFQCIGRVKKSIFLALSRQLIFVIPALWLLPKFFGCEGIWWATPLADFLATFTSAFMLYDQRMKWKKKMLNTYGDAAFRM